MVAHAYVPQGNNYPNQSHGELIRLVNKIIEGSGWFIGSSIDIWLFPIGPQGLNSPPPTLSLGIIPPSHYCYIDIAGCGFLINCIFT